MKKILIASLALMTITTACCAFAETHKNNAFNVTYMASHMADWGKTLEYSSKCTSDSGIKTNIVLGSCPSSQSINAYFLSTAILRAGVTQLLPAKYRHSIQTSPVAMEVGYFDNNARVGFNMRF